MMKKPRELFLTVEQIIKRITALRGDKELEDSMSAKRLSPEDHQRVASAVEGVQAWLEDLLKRNTVVTIKMSGTET